MADSIPTGYSPLLLTEIGNPVVAIGQKMVERQRQYYDERKSAAEANQAALIKALDFETVQGMSDAVQLDHIKQLESLKQTWAEKYAKKEGMLSSNDLLELSKDKKRIEQDIASKKWNVAMFYKNQEEFNKNPMAWEPESLNRMAAFAAEGNVGKDPSGLLIPKFNITDVFQKYVAPDLKAAIRDEAITINGRTYTIEESNRRRVEEVAAKWKSHPYFATAIASNPKMATEFDALTEGKALEATKERFTPSSGSASAANAAKKDAALEARKEEFAKIAYGASRGNKEMLSQFTQAYLAGSGKVISAEVVGNKIILYGPNGSVIKSISANGQEAFNEFANMLYETKPFSDQPFAAYTVGKLPKYAELESRYSDIVPKTKDAEFTPDFVTTLKEDITALNQKLPEGTTSDFGKSKKTRVGNKFYNVSSDKKEAGIQEIAKDYFNESIPPDEPALKPLYEAFSSNTKTSSVAKIIGEIAGKGVTYKGGKGWNNGSVDVFGETFDLSKTPEINKLLRLLAGDFESVDEVKQVLIWTNPGLTIGEANAKANQLWNE